MPSRLSDRLMEASRRLFVGRVDQCRIFEEALGASELPFNILHVYGPGGIGKTSLLYEYRRSCKQHEVPATYLDARMLEADSVAFVEALRGQLSLASSQHPGDLLGTSGRHVLMIDTFELFYSLEQWLYNEFFTTLGDEVLIVLAGRYPPSAMWNNHPGWRSLMQIIALRNLSPEETRDFLTRIALPADSHDTVLGFTHGHPLALSLIADSFMQRPDIAFSPRLGQDFIKVLLDRFVRDVPSSMHRRALEACAMVNNLTESLLAVILEQKDVSGMFDWLRQLSFIESGVRGIFPHDLAREILGSELRWRNPERHRELHKRARIFYNKRLHKASPDEQGLILTDYIFLHRDHPVVQPFFARLQSELSQGDAPVSSDRYSPRDQEGILETVRQHEGEEAAGYARIWLERQPHNVIVYRNPNGSVAGFLFMLALHEASKDELQSDPLAWKCWSHIDSESPLRAGEAATLFRFWMDRESHQQISRVQSTIFVNMVRHYLTTPNLAYSLLPIVLPDFWQAIFSYADLHRLEALNFSLNDVPFGVYGHDWRRRPPAAWLDLLASRESGTSIEEAPVPSTARPILVLSEEAFVDATRDALRDYTRPYTLKGNPLLSSRIVADNVDEEADDEDRISVLMGLLDESIEALEQNTRHQKVFRAVYRTYIKPAASQELAAEMLGIPYSTFRRHLTKGVKEITDLLWQREVDH